MQLISRVPFTGQWHCRDAADCYGATMAFATARLQCSRDGWGMMVQAVEVSHFAAFTNAGQFCTAASRLFVHADIYDAFMAKAIKRAQAR